MAGINLIEGSGPKRYLLPNGSTVAAAGSLGGEVGRIAAQYGLPEATAEDARAGAIQPSMGDGRRVQVTGLALDPATAVNAQAQGDREFSALDTIKSVLGGGEGDGKGEDKPQLSRADKGMLLMQLGFTMMEEGAKPGATLGSSLGAGGKSALAGYRDIMAGKKRDAREKRGDRLQEAGLVIDAATTDDSRRHRNRAFAAEKAHRDRTFEADTKHRDRVFEADQSYRSKSLGLDYAKLDADNKYRQQQLSNKKDSETSKAATDANNKRADFVEALTIKGMLEISDYGPAAPRITREQIEEQASFNFPDAPTSKAWATKQIEDMLEAAKADPALAEKPEFQERLQGITTRFFPDL